MPINPLIGFKIDPTELKYRGQNLSRAECILAIPDGTLFTSHSEGILKMLPSGEQSLISRKADYDHQYARPSVPNGIALMPDGNFLIANLGMRLIDRMAPDGNCVVAVAELHGARCGEVNFVMCDPKGGYWATIATHHENSFDAYNNGVINDGCVIRVDSGGTKVFAEGIAYANEVRLDANGEYLYVVESFAFHITRFRVGADGVGCDREIFGPTNLGGIPDGIAFDSFGNLWVTLIGVDQLGFITPGGDFHIVLELSSPECVIAFQTALNEHRVGYSDLMADSHNKIQILTSLTFGGADLQTVYLGSLTCGSLPYFRAPVAGLPMPHWY